MPREDSCLRRYFYAILLTALAAPCFGQRSTASIAGKVVVTNGKTMLQVSGSNEMLELIPDSSAAALAPGFEGKSVLVDGTIPEAGKGKSLDSIRYRSVKEEDLK